MHCNRSWAARCFCWRNGSCVWEVSTYSFSILSLRISVFAYFCMHVYACLSTRLFDFGHPFKALTQHTFHLGTHFHLEHAHSLQHAGTQHISPRMRVPFWFFQKISLLTLSHLFTRKDSTYVRIKVVACTGGTPINIFSVMFPACRARFCGRVSPCILAHITSLPAIINLHFHQDCILGSSVQSFYSAPARVSGREQLRQYTNPHHYEGSLTRACIHAHKHLQAKTTAMRRHTSRRL
jgi:hypothetical protein